MNKYDLELQRQKELREQFNATKTEEEKKTIKDIRDKFLQSKEMITKEEYNQLIKYYFGLDLLDTLKYEEYKPTNFTRIKDKRELYILDRVVRACFILG